MPPSAPRKAPTLPYATPPVPAANPRPTAANLLLLLALLSIILAAWLGGSLIAAIFTSASFSAARAPLPWLIFALVVVMIIPAVLGVTYFICYRQLQDGSRGAAVAGFVLAIVNAAGASCALIALVTGRLLSSATGSDGVDPTYWVKLVLLLLYILAPTLLLYYLVQILRQPRAPHAIPPARLPPARLIAYNTPH